MRLVVSIENDFLGIRKIVSSVAFDEERLLEEGLPCAARAVLATKELLGEELGELNDEVEARRREFMQAVKERFPKEGEAKCST